MLYFRQMQKATINRRIIHAMHWQFKVEYCETESNNYAILIPPSRETGATMNNHIIRLMFEIFVKRKWNVLRFDFSDYAPANLSLQARSLLEINCITDWYMKRVSQNKNRLIMAGYGFGAMMALEVLMRRPEINGFIALSLCGQSSNNIFLAPCPHPGLFVHGRFDKIAPLDKVQEIVRKLQIQQADIEMQILDDDHFFSKYRQDLLKDIITDYVEALELRDVSTHTQNNSDYYEEDMYDNYNDEN